MFKAKFVQILFFRESWLQQQQQQQQQQQPSNLNTEKKIKTIFFVRNVYLRA